MAPRRGLFGEMHDRYRYFPSFSSSSPHHRQGMMMNRTACCTYLRPDPRWLRSVSASADAVTGRTRPGDNYLRPDGAW